MAAYYEFFAGGGMARAGLGEAWRCLFSNDFDHKKSAAYRLNWGGGELKTCDVRHIALSDLPERANLVWASFPCQDLSLAGSGAGLKGERSGTFWPFWEIVKGLIAEGRAPELITLENVCGALSSHEGKDFAAICAAFGGIGYRFGAMVVDAALFVPQSRPRLFFIGMRDDLCAPSDLFRRSPSPLWHPSALVKAHGNLPAADQRLWVWWDMPTPPKRNVSFVDLVENSPEGVAWHSPEETHQLLAMMTTLNRVKVENAREYARLTGKRMVGAVYKRTRRDENGAKAQRAEVRFDDVAGCLRTPAGGSSRQLILVIDQGDIRSRLVSSRETARLMGLPDTYQLPESYNEAYHLTGDGVALPVVRYIAENILHPLLTVAGGMRRAA